MSGITVDVRESASNWLQSIVGRLRDLSSSIHVSLVTTLPHEIGYVSRAGTIDNPLVFA